MSMYFTGIPISGERYSEPMQQVAGRYEVSTVHICARWETCIFGVDDSRVVETYRSDEEAEAGHKKWVEACESGRYRLPMRPITGNHKE